MTHRPPNGLLVFYVRPYLSLCFNGYFSGEPGLDWSKGWRKWRWQLDYWSYKSCKAPVKSSPPTNQHPVFLQAGCPSCHPTNNVKALKGKISHSMYLVTPSSPGGLVTLSLTTNSSWLPWERVAMPLIRPLMPVLQTEECQTGSSYHLSSNLRRYWLICHSPIC